MPKYFGPRNNSWLMSEDLLILMYPELSCKKLSILLHDRTPDAIKNRRSQLRRREPAFLLSRYVHFSQCKKQ